MSDAEAQLRTERIGNLLARYEGGEFEGVWREIRSYPNIGGEFRAEVLEVAEATMRRVARNADLLTSRLCEHGWRALAFEDDNPRTRPASADDPIFQRVEEITESPIPPSLLAFWRVAGGINWIWDYDSEAPAPDLGAGLPLDEMDPLCVGAPNIACDFESWEDQKGEADPDLIDPFMIELAPDYLHKANISGGPSYGVELPFFGGDPLFANEIHNLPFIDYLRLSFRWAGFPRLEEYSDRDEVRRFVARFGKGLEPF